MSASVGLMICSKENSNYSGSQIVTQTSQAMNSAKIAGGNQYKVYDTSVGVEAQREATLYGDLKTAILRDELSVSYQEIQDVLSPGLMRFEALIRWNHPNLSHISPLEFIPLAEKSGAINELGKYVVESVCKQIAIWNQQYSIRTHVSINISTSELLLRPVAEHLFETMERYQIDPSSIGIEVTESQALQEIDEVSDTFKVLRSKGISVSIDDFGTGYSSFSYIKKLPIDIIKIDKSFVDGIIDNKKDGLLILSIIEMAHRLNFKVVAEGVETKEQYDALIKMKCNYIQGYYLGKPMPADCIKSPEQGRVSIASSN
jgi:EAL domain-containing protein (putative c-di-GMP-specific phosphodiesterase class I)